MGSAHAPFDGFLRTVEKATNETQKREAFITLAAKGFGEGELATDLALGAEYKVRFQSTGLLKRGAIDSFFGNLIIEFEFSLEKTRDHALDQLRGYIAGAWTEDKSSARPYLAVATDGDHWEVFAPRLADPDGLVSSENVRLGDPIEAWSPSGEDDSASLREFLNRLFFRKTLLKPTATNFARDFGLSSPAYIRARAQLSQKLAELAGDSELEVLQGAWKESLQIAYGSVDTGDELFAKHTYLAALARLLVWTALEHRALKAGETEKVLSGLYFRDKVANLVEADFFRWYELPSKTDAAPIWVGVSKQLIGYDLAAVREDILKPLYESLVDPSTRHELGEYYTPDWLATRVVERLLRNHDWKKGAPSILDPSCGSGTFVRVAIDKVRGSRKSVTPAELLDEILSRVMGIDVHPLAVIIARATYLLAIKDLLKHADGPITLPVFLANALSMPPLQRDLIEDVISLEIDGTPYDVPVDFVLHGADYDAAIEEVLQVAHAYGKPSTSLDQAPMSFKARIGSSLKQYDASGKLVQNLGNMARHIASLIRQRRNTVHGFLLKNHYRPSMLRHSFDFVVGNPPWLTVGQIATPRYKDTVIRLATETDITSRSAGEQSHTELATVFLTVAVGNFLRTGDDKRARVALVMPRSLLTAKHHKRVREGSYKQRFDFVEIWDLGQVTPLFNIPSCVVFVAASATPQPSATKPGVVLSGNLPEKDVPASVAEKHIETEDVQFNLSFLGKRSAWVVADGGKSKGKTMPSKSENAYVKTFRQGAILYPQTLLVVEPQGVVASRTGSVRVLTAKDAIETAKKSKDVVVDHVIDTPNLFLTAAADHIFPFTLGTNLWHVVLPTIVDPGDASFATVDPNVLRLHGRIHTAGWLEWAEKQWEAVRKQGDKTALAPRLDKYGHLSANNEQRRYLVLYTAAGTRPVAAVVDSKELTLPFVARDRTFWGSFSSAPEAHYLAAFLNSDYAADVIVGWMNRGLFGPRDINKRILDVRWPKFDNSSKDHQELSDVAKELAKEARAALASLPKKGAGIQRRWMREHLSGSKLKAADRLVKRICENG